MDKHQTLTYYQALSLLKLEDKLDELKQDAFYQKVILKVRDHVTRIEDFKKNQETSRYITLSKQEHRETLEVICFQISNGLKYQGFINDFVPFRDLKGYGKNQLYKYSGLNLLNKSKYLLVFTQKYGKEVEDAELDTALMKNLAKAISDFEKLLEKPQNHIESVKKATAAISDELRAYSLLLNRVIKPYMYSKYEQTQPEIYSRFLISLKGNKISKRKRALIGRITDTNGNLLHRVRVSVDGKKPEVKRGTKGNYFYKNMTNGSHQLKFSCKGYEPILKEVLILASQTTRLNVVMQRESQQDK
ncbi:carboxypeptidase regulatory-like domain-containing protein [Ancylomarina euxinus]|uniref:Carboxypeptidase regulatory-like domain-containing protein n=1 Tax=Ancylomarina euxinus TaxID=2283627 RepID=A0A425XX63_9BACT|nr:carboxypeptidase-like regulatory domain-containing protein [Ancylomarina euxinus]MCZ4696184.1 carboxypeptidase-like regulatory domain-containing protein [Ancylomarina euxinus]RRG19241.1 carboxypeptidase regulatory-like domain-containing protein [Ancylomarina euxinus]